MMLHFELQIPAVYLFKLLFRDGITFYFELQITESHYLHKNLEHVFPKCESGVCTDKNVISYHA